MSGTNPQSPSPSAISAAARDSRRSRNAIRNAGAYMFFLPPYSPDYNPIENPPKTETLRREADGCSVEAIWRSVGEVLKAFNPTECAAYLSHPAFASKINPTDSNVERRQRHACKVFLVLFEDLIIDRAIERTPMR